MITRSETIAKLAGALAKAQGEMRPASKDSLNPHFKSKYADLASVWEACRAPLSKHGLAVVQTVAQDGERIAVTTMLVHAEGEWISDVLHLLPQNPSPQAAGSAITFGRRYALAALVGVAPDDDDGEAAMARGVQMTHTAGGKAVRAKVDIVTGEIKQKASEWTPEQTAEAGQLRQAISEVGGEAGDKAVRTIWDAYKYSAPSDCIDALAVELRRWEDIADSASSERQ